MIEFILARIVGGMTRREFLRKLKRLCRAGWMPSIHENGTLLLKRPGTGEWMTPIGAVSFVRHQEDSKLFYSDGHTGFDDWNNAGANLGLPYMAKHYYRAATRSTLRDLEKEGLEKKWIRKRYRARRRMLKALKLKEE